ncbi:F-box protein At3g26010-like [Quercus lobata]|nr:F-box protein At3g26010-like [Quercus lobata]
MVSRNLGVGMKNQVDGWNANFEKQLTKIEDLPISLLLEILYRLDLKSAMRCKSVARQWCNLISDPSFANNFVRLHASSVMDRPFALLLNYVDKQIKKRHLLVTSEEPEFKSLTYIPPIYQHDNIEVTVQASCNDLLLCCANMVGNDAGSGPMSEYYVINPISRQWTALPPMPQLARARVGFICWYDTALHKQLSYRVMRIPEFKGESAEFGVEIFSSDTGKWTQSVGLCPQGFRLDVFAFPGVPYNGLLFWWSSTDCLVGFDPNTSKCCQFFEKPVELNPSHGIERLGVCHGTLRICQISGYPYEVAFADPCLRVWELKDYDEGGKWNLEHELYFDKMVSEKSPWLTEYLSKKYPTVAVLAYHPNDGEIVYLMIKFKVVSCNLRRKTLEVVCDIPTADYFYHGCNVFTFVLPCWPTPIPFQTEKAT